MVLITNTVKNILVKILYIINKYLNKINVVFLFLYLSPFFVGSDYVVLSYIKYYTAIILSLIIIFLFLMHRLITLDFRLQFNYYIVIIFLFFALAATSVILTYGKYDYSPELYGGTPSYKIKREIFVITTIFCCYQIINFNSFFKLIKIFYYSYFLSLIGVLWNIFYYKEQGSGDVNDYLFKISSFMKDPNIYGIYLVLIILLSFLFYLKTNTSNSFLRKKYSIIGLSALFVLFFTYSRSSYLVLLLFIIILFFLLENLKIKKIMIYIFCLLLIVFTPLIMKRMKENVTVSNISQSDYARLSTNLAAINMIKDNIFTGIGYQNSRYVIKNYQNKKFPLIMYIFSIHNIYITIFAELGIIGISIILIYTILLFKESYSLVRKTRFPNNIIFLFNFCFICAYIIHGLIYHYFFERQIYWFLTMICLLSFKYKNKIVENMQTFNL